VLFAEKEFPESANAFDSQHAWPHERADDLASGYVQIKS
jgi:hypothetical protein